MMNPVSLHNEPFCPDIQDKLPDGLRNLKSDVYYTVRAQLMQALQLPSGASLLNTEQRNFLVDYAKAYWNLQETDTPLPQPVRSATVLGGSLYVLRSTASLTDEEKELIKILQATPAIASTAETLRESFLQTIHPAQQTS